MSSGYERAGANANRRDEVMFAQTKGAAPKRTNIRDAVAQVVREALNSKALTEFTGTGIRAAQNVLNGRNAMSFESFVGLLRSDVGPSVLDAIMNYGDVPEWYARQQIILRIAESERQADEAKKELQALRRDLTRR